MTTRRPTGFGMIEVLVALVLVTSVGVAIVMWVENGLHSVNRLRDQYERIQAVRMVEEWARSLPFDMQDNGEKQFDGLRIVWQRRIVGPARPQVGYPGGYGGFDISLFEYRLQVFRPAEPDRPWFESRVVNAAAQKVRDFTPPFAGMPK